VVLAAVKKKTTCRFGAHAPLCRNYAPRSLTLDLRAVSCRQITSFSSEVDAGGANSINYTVQHSRGRVGMSAGFAWNNARCRDPLDGMFCRVLTAGVERVSFLHRLGQGRYSTIPPGSTRVPRHRARICIRISNLGKAVAGSEGKLWDTRPNPYALGVLPTVRSDW
jgi:hypothetical protein